MGNILKFLQKLKEKDKFLHKPHDLPDTAKDVYGDVSHTVHKKIEDRNKKEEKAPSEIPGEGEAAPEKFSDRDVSEFDGEVSKDYKGKPVEEPPSISNSVESNKSEQDKKGFDNKLSEQKKVVDSKPREEFYSVDEGFFRDFHRFLDGKGLNEKLISEVLDKDLLHKMKQFHTLKEDGMPFFFHREDSERELGEKLAELQKLEEEWYIRHREFKEMEVVVLEKEAEIDLRLEELKVILKHLKQREKLEKKASRNEYFKLADGREIRSLGELRDLLKNMDDKLFSYHVSKDKNNFADWCEHVFKEVELSSKIRDVMSRKELLDVLFNF